MSAHLIIIFSVNPLRHEVLKTGSKDTNALKQGNYDFIKNMARKMPREETAGKGKTLIVKATGPGEILRGAFFV
jgi:hypothetical protein